MTGSLPIGMLQRDKQNLSDSRFYCPIAAVVPGTFYCFLMHDNTAGVAVKIAASSLVQLRSNTDNIYTDLGSEVQKGHSE